MPMVPLYMSSRQPHPTRYEAKPPSSHVPMQHQSFAKPPSIHPSMPATSLPINQSTVMRPECHPTQKAFASLRAQEEEQVVIFLQLVESINSWKSIIRRGPPCQPRNTGHECPHARWVPPPSHARALVQEWRQSTHRPMVLPRVVVL